MKISVIIPVYNVETYICKCIDSLLSQTYMPYEIILVDDESKDDSGKIADTYASKYDFIKVIHKQNGGLGYARNTGLENANGEWIIFLDSDDYFDENLIMDLVENQNKYDADVVIGGYKKVNDAEKVLFEYKYNDEVYKDEEIVRSLLPRFLGSAPDKSDSISMSVCNCLFSLELIRKYKIVFPTERYVISEDLFFNFDFYIRAKTVVLTSTTNYNYRSTQGSLTTSYRENRYQLSKNLYKEMLKRIEEYNLGVEYKYRLMRSMFNYWRMCFAQEERRISGKTLKEEYKDIYDICNDDLTQSIIKDYPKNDLNYKQKSFLKMVKYKNALMLSFLIEIGYFRMV